MMTALIVTSARTRSALLIAKSRQIAMTPNEPRPLSSVVVLLNEPRS